ncbi:transaldolase family protein [Clostridium botulinum]|uniref:transaldolase family protein n=1 Tax=Clostridium botulinum TaxID=1491 RepID=UPI001FB00DD0|nr:transaldolase family protein [Clostridium botulinum]
MIYILDTANLQEIKRAYEFYPMEGITTNPSIISKEREDFIKILKNIREIIGNDLTYGQLFVINLNKTIIID